MKKNLLYVNYSLGVGGIETLLLECSKYLLGTGQYNIFFLIFDKGSDVLFEKFTSLGIKVIEVPKKPKVDLSLPFKINKVINDYDIDIVHAHNQNTWLYCSLGCFFSKASHIQTIHSGVDKYRGRQQLRWKLLAFMLSCITSKITTVAEYLKQDLLRLKIKESNILTIHNGIEFARFDNDSQNEVEAKSLVMVARFAPQKNHKTLIQAMKKVVTVDPEVKLYLAGTGELQDECEALVKDLNLQGNIIFLGHVDDVASLLKSKTIYVLPSVLEGLSISLLEAMCCKITILASSNVSNIEVLTDNENALMFNVFDSKQLSGLILKLVGDVKLQSRLSEKAYSDVQENFTFELMMGKYITLYNSLSANSIEKH